MIGLEEGLCSPHLCRSVACFNHSHDRFVIVLHACPHRSSSRRTQMPTSAHRNVLSVPDVSSSSAISSLRASRLVPETEVDGFIGTGAIRPRRGPDWDRSVTSQSSNASSSPSPGPVGSRWEGRGTESLMIAATTAL